MSIESRDHIEVIKENIEDNNQEGNEEKEEKTFVDNFKGKIYSCDLCKIKVTSEHVLRRHLMGRKHTLRFERQGKTFACELCKITANSQSQLDAHLRSSKHKANLNRKNHPLKYRCGQWLFFFCLICVCINFLLIFMYIL